MVAPIIIAITMIYSTTTCTLTAQGMASMRIKRLTTDPPLTGGNLDIPPLNQAIISQVKVLLRVGIPVLPATVRTMRPRIITKAPAPRLPPWQAPTMATPPHTTAPSGTRHQRRARPRRTPPNPMSPPNHSTTTTAPNTTTPLTTTKQQCPSRRTLAHQSPHVQRR